MPSASLWDILRSIVTVTGALADAPPAVLTAAVAVNTSAAACPRGDAGVNSNAAESTRRTNRLVCSGHGPPLQRDVPRLQEAGMDSNPRSAAVPAAAGTIAIVRASQMARLACLRHLGSPPLFRGHDIDVVPPSSRPRAAPTRIPAASWPPRAGIAAAGTAIARLRLAIRFAREP